MARLSPLPIPRCTPPIWITTYGTRRVSGLSRVDRRWLDDAYAGRSPSGDARALRVVSLSALAWDSRGHHPRAPFPHERLRHDASRNPRLIWNTLASMLEAECEEFSEHLRRIDEPRPGGGGSHIVISCNQGRHRSVSEGILVQVLLGVPAECVRHLGVGL